jgi:Domain of unknown function (DUF4148)
MNFNPVLSSAFALFAAVGAAQAQTTMQPATAASGGEMSTPRQDQGSKPAASTNSREAVKAEAKAARASGTMPMGEQSTPNQGKKPPMRSSSDTTREAVKAEAKAARQAGDLPKGQESVKDQAKGSTRP